MTKTCVYRRTLPSPVVLLILRPRVHHPQCAVNIQVEGWWFQGNGFFFWPNSLLTSTGQGVVIRVLLYLFSQCIRAEPLMACLLVTWRQWQLLPHLNDARWGVVTSSNGRKESLYCASLDAITAQDKKWLAMLDVNCVPLLTESPVKHLGNLKHSTNNCN